MAAPPVRFDDGAAYERMMGGWSRLAGEVFLDWLAPAPGLAWLDAGCGNGAFTEALVARATPALATGLDPSRGQLDFARSRPGARGVLLVQGDALALPFPDAIFDAAVMALVVFFLPDPARGITELARVVRPGGMVAAYAWDMPGGGFPYHAVREELAARGMPPPQPPHPEASSRDGLAALWVAAGLEAVATREIAVGRAFEAFEPLWEEMTRGPATRAALDALPPAEMAAVRAGVRGRLPHDAAGRIL
jgi:SAM-dependent methyltransferase